MNSTKLLEIIGHFNGGTKLHKILKIYELLGLSEEYSSSESFRVAIIEHLNSLHEKGLIEIDKQYYRTYKLSDLGIKMLSKIKLWNMIDNEILEKVI